MNTLIYALRKRLPFIVTEFNTVCLPALEVAWGRNFHEEWKNEDPKSRTSEITKVLSRVVNNVVFRHLRDELPDFVESGMKGYDCKLGDIEIEDKNSFSESDSWTGNGFKKTPWHLLKKFKLDEHGRITHVFVALVDLSKCTGCWSEKTTSSNFSALKFTCEDAQHLQIVRGRIENKSKYLRIIPDAL